MWIIHNLKTGWAIKDSINSYRITRVRKCWNSLDLNHFLFQIPRVLLSSPGLATHWGRQYYCVSSARKGCGYDGGSWTFYLPFKSWRICLKSPWEFDTMRANLQCKNNERRQKGERSHSANYFTSNIFKENRSKYAVGIEIWKAAKCGEKSPL